MPKPILGVFIADLQSGSKTAVAKPIVLDDGDTYTPSLHQDWLYNCLQSALKRVQIYAKGHDVHMKFGGDMVDGVAHHGSSQTFGTTKDQRALAVDLCMPFVNMAARMDGLRGTDAHTGASGDGDRAVYRELGIPDKNIHYRARQQYGNHILDWAHHTGAGRKPNTRGNGLKALINEVYFQNLECGEPIPSLIVSHHVHLYDDVSDHRKGIRAVNCPGWQLNTAFTRKIGPRGLASIGLLLWWPETMRVLPLLYKPKEDPIERVA